MPAPIQLRPATPDDAELLLEWRNDAQTRRDSHNPEAVPRDQHQAWLAAIIADPARQLYIAMEQGVAVGTARAVWDAEVWELSWTVAPTARGRGVAKRMVAHLAAQLRQALRAEIKPGNDASVRVAEYAGLKYVGKIDGVWHFARPAVDA